MKDVTLCFLIREDTVCLAMKKRGFGAGKWNGAGGKVHQGETIESAAIRELKEELGVEAQTKHLEKVAEIQFIYKDKPEWNQKGHVFLVSSWEGEPIESEEMRPDWFSHKDLPFSSMWVDDPLWLPLVFNGEKLKAEIFFEGEGSVVSAHTLSPLSLENRPF